MDKNKLTIRILLILVILMAAVLIYVFILRPVVSGYVIDKQIGAYNQAQMDLINNIWVQIQQTGAAQISLDEGNVLLLTGEIRQIQQQ